MIKSAIFGNILGNIRFSNYLQQTEVAKHIIMLRKYYDIHYA